MFFHHCSKIAYVLILALLFFLFQCRRIDLKNDCDPRSKDYLINATFVQLFNIQSAGCYPSFKAIPSAPNVKRPSLWGFYSLEVGNPIVRDIAISGTRGYVAGNFDYVGPNTGSLVMLDGSTQNLLPESSCPYFEIDGSITQIIDDGSGNAIVAGAFNHVFGVKRRGIAKVKSDCTLDSTFDVKMADTSAEVRTILLLNGKLYIGGMFSGTFSTNGTETRSHFAVVNPSTGNLDTTWTTTVTGSEVNVLESDGTHLYIAGAFTTVGVTSVNNLAKVDLATGNTVTQLGEPDASVQSIVIDGSNLYVGGAFNTIAGNATDFLAKITNTGTFLWGNLVSIDATVIALSLSNNKLYVGGNFNSPRSGLITINPADGTDLVKDFQLTSGGIVSIRKLDGKLFLIGSFPGMLSDTTSFVTSLDPTNDTLVKWNARIAGSNSIERGGIFKFRNGNILLGASFPTLQGKKRTFLAEIDLVSGEATDWNPTFTQPGGVEVIRAMHLFQNRLYITGDFTAIGSITRTRFASFDLGNSFIPSTPTLNDINVTISGYTQIITKIGDYNDQILVTGGFANVSGVPINHTVFINPTTKMASYAFNPNTNFGVNDFLKLSNGKFIIAGDFNLINGATAINRFAVVNESNGNLLQSPSGSNIGLVNRVIEVNNKLIVGYAETASPAGAGCCIGVYDIDNFAPISQSFNVLPPTGQKISNLFVSGNELFLMGSFTSVKGEARRNFAVINTGNDQLTTFNPIFSAEVSQMRETPTDFFLMGRFPTVDGRKRACLARFSKSNRSLVE
jgi:hypothetical protein